MTQVLTDPRQFAYRGALNQLAPNATTMLPVDQVIASIESEVTNPLELRASGPASLILNVTNILVTNPQTSRNRTIPPISSIIPAFTSATITFPSSGTGNVTTSAGSSTLTLAMSATQQMIVAFFLDANGNINFTGGTPATTITQPFTVPQISGLLPIGFAIISTNGSNVVQSITNANIYQLPMGAGGSGTGNANTILETLKNQLVDSPYQLLTTNIIATNGQALFSTLTGATYDIVTNTIKFTADGQVATSTAMLDTTEFLPQALAIGNIDLSAFWNRASTFAVPTTKTFTNLAASVTNTSSTVTVTAPSHGLTSGKKVYVLTSTGFGGLTKTQISGGNNSVISTVTTVTITVVDANTFTYAATASATSTATGTLDFVISGFIYLASRNSGADYFPLSMSQVGSTEAMYGSLQWGLTPTTEAASLTLLAQDTGGSHTNISLDATSNQALSTPFTVPANTNWSVSQFLFVFSITGSPTGNIFASIYQSSGGLPTGTPIAQSLPIAASSITNGSNFLTLPATILPGGSAGTTYQMVLTTDATYKSSYSVGVRSLNPQTSNGTVSAETTVVNSFNGTTWIQNTNTAGLTNFVNGYIQDLRIRIVSASDTSLVYPVGLDGYGVFYNLQNTGVVGATKKNQRFVFNSVTDNTSSFTITTFVPDPDLLSCYWVEGGQVFKAPAFSVQGNTVAFPASTFNQGGVSQTITLIFDQNTGGAFDNSDLNAQLLAANHLGSTSGAIDKSQAGRGVQLRDAAGTLRELAISGSSDQVQVLNTSQVAVNTLIDSTNAQTAAGSKTFSTSPLTVGSDAAANEVSINVRAGAGQRADIYLLQGGVTRTTLAAAAGTNDFAPGTSVGDTVLRTEGKNILISTDSGSSSAVQIAATTGKVTFNNGTGFGSSFDSGETSYAGVPVASGGTAPSGILTAFYRWTQVGNVVTLAIMGSYAVAGSANTQIFVPFPSGAPKPSGMSVVTTDGRYAYQGNGAFETSDGAVSTTTPCLVNVTKNAAGTPQFEVRLASGSVAGKVFRVSVTYFT